MIRALILPLAIGLSFIFLMALGTWQMLRLEEKEALIARVEAQLKAPPISIDEAIGRFNENKDIEFLPIEIKGHFIKDAVRRYFITKNGEAGWYIYQPLLLNDGQNVLWINRGFVAKSNEEFIFMPLNEVHFLGLLRKDLVKKPNSFVPDNDGVKNIYYWKNIKAMSEPFQNSLLKNKVVLPFFMDAGLPEEAKVSTKKLNEGKEKFNEGKLILQSGVTRVEFPNNHLQYAVTWYGLGLACLGVGFAFWRSRRKNNTDG